MVLGTFMNALRSGSGFVYEDSYQVWQNLLRIFQVKNFGNLLLVPPANNLDDINQLE